MNSQPSPFFPFRHSLPPRMNTTPYHRCNISDDQEFKYFVVIHFEATCDGERTPQPQEIIEFSSVLVNAASHRLEGSFQQYVRPVHHPQLSEFCKNLTGIQQSQVDRGVPLIEAVRSHDRWLDSIGMKKKSFVLVTWTDWDCRVMLEHECVLKGITKPPYFNRWINLRNMFVEGFGGGHCSLEDAVRLAGLTRADKASCGLGDARVIARLLVFLMQKGVKLSLANSVTVNQNQRATAWPIPRVGLVGWETRNCCFCGVPSNKSMVRKPGPNQGRYFFGCGNWTPCRRSVCSYFVWASP